MKAIFAEKSNRVIKSKFTKKSKILRNNQHGMTRSINKAYNKRHIVEACKMIPNVARRHVFG